MAGNKILIVGGTGMLGSEIACRLSDSNEIIALGSKEIDISVEKQTFEKVKEFSPDLIINCAAITDVDLCEEQKELAYAVNSSGAENLAMAAFTAGAKLIHYSTDYVFGGASEKAYVEIDSPDPINHYGVTKLSAEMKIMNVSDDFLILRVAWIYARHEKAFVQKLIKSGVEQLIKKGHGEEYSPLKIVSDQYGTPTYAGDIADQTKLLIENDLTGLYHCTAEGSTNRYEMAQFIFEQMKMPVEIESVDSNQFEWKAERPLFTVLENSALKSKELNIMPDYEESLKIFLANEDGR